MFEEFGKSNLFTRFNQGAALLARLFALGFCSAECLMGEAQCSPGPGRTTLEQEMKKR
jgi:hypothetical protein